MTTDVKLKLVETREGFVVVLEGFVTESIVIGRGKTRKIAYTKALKNLNTKRNECEKRMGNLKS